MGVECVVVAAGLMAASGVPGLLLGRRASVGQRLATVLAVLGGALGIFGAVSVLCGGGEQSLILHTGFSDGSPGLPATLQPTFEIAVDAISAIFLLPIFLVSALGSIYGTGYWKQSEHPANGQKLRFFYGLLAAGLAMVAVARDGVLFLIAWEVMALSAYFLVTTEDDDSAACDAGWVYLIATHVATLCLVAMFGLIYRATGSFSLSAMSSISPGLATAIFLLALIGFGLKAGIMPLHVWLPGAHANAPSHVSAIMSGVLIKMGIYGIVRITGLLPVVPAWWGALLLALGVVSGVLGVVFAIAQHDIKRLLAYHSIENIGIIVMGLGLAMLGRAMGRGDWVVLGLAGALLHVWNHGLFKSLLFLSAGSVIHATGTRQIDQLGGLAKKMPLTALMFLVGAVAICGLPPLNGFVSELLVYMGLFRTFGIGEGANWPAAALAAPALAMIGALAVACFVKVYGIVFLGEPRTTAAQHGHEAPRSMVGPMFVLAGLCAFIGLLPWLVADVFDQAVKAWGGATRWRVAGLAPLFPISAIGIAATLAAAGGYILLRRWMARKPFAVAGTWDCGYAAPTARMQYTASSFAQMLVKLFGRILRPRTHGPRIEGPFPTKSHYESHVDDTVLDGGIVPAFRGIDRLLSGLRFLQQGRVQIYLLYILIVVVVLLWL